MDHTIIFNHIPKTAGTTLRILLNRVYSPERVYFIESTNITRSLQRFKELTDSGREQYKVIAGHGASSFMPLVSNPFRITILREPVDQFISQYSYLRKSPNSIYRDDVARLESIEEYIKYAKEKGHDNLLTRYLSESLEFLADPEVKTPDMDKSGENLLNRAKINLKQYDAVLSVRHFDRGVYRLKKLLQWEKIPVYRPVNITKPKLKGKLKKQVLEKINDALRYDRQLWDFFLENQLDCANDVKVSRFRYRVFISRQRFINKYLPRS
ncbi:MAG: sulfotransferase family 2 domain-containing protein [bacterium]|jgi:hypothetical protein